MKSVFQRHHTSETFTVEGTVTAQDIVQQARELAWQIPFGPSQSFEDFFALQLLPSPEPALGLLLFNAAQELVSFELIFIRGDDPMGLATTSVVRRALGVGAVCVAIAQSALFDKNGSSNSADKAMAQKVFEALRSCDIDVLEYFVLEDGHIKRISLDAGRR